MKTKRAIKVKPPTTAQQALRVEIGPRVGELDVGGHAHEQIRVPTHAAWDSVVFFAHAKL